MKRPTEGRTREAGLGIVWVGVCFGLTAGIAEGITGWIFSVAPVQRGWKSGVMPEILWQAPVVNTFLCGLAGAVVALFRRSLQRWGLRPEPVAWAAAGLLAIYAPLAASERLYPAACLLLAFGGAVRLYVCARDRWSPSNRRLGSSLASLALATLLLNVVGLASGVPRTITDSTRATAELGGRPNVLLIVLDTLRAGQLSSYGYSRPTTPNLDRLAKDGALFEKAFVTAANTLESHASMFTGRYPFEHRISPSAPLDASFKTLAEYLYERGYQTAAFVANLKNLSVPTGLAQGFETYDDSTLLSEAAQTAYGKLIAAARPRLGYYDHPGRKRAEELNQEFLGWLEHGRDPGRPFFAFLNYFDVHDPYLPPPGYELRFSKRANPGNRINGQLFPKLHVQKQPLSEAEIAEEMAAYDASLVYLDAELGRLLERLSALQILDQTFLIVTSDHGESFGNHGLFVHGKSVYRDVIHVPLIVRYPGRIPRELRIDHTVSLQSLPATITELLRLGTKSPFPRPSLIAHLQVGDSDARCDQDVAFAETRRATRRPAFPRGLNGRVRSLASSEWHLILYEEGGVELFHLDRDPLEQHNLAETPEGRQAIGVLQPMLATLMAALDGKVFGPVVAEHTR